MSWRPIVLMAALPLALAGCGDQVLASDQARAGDQVVQMSADGACAAAGDTCAAPVLVVEDGSPIDLGAQASVELAATTVPAAAVTLRPGPDGHWQIRTDNLRPGRYLVSLMFADRVAQLQADVR